MRRRRSGFRRGRLSRAGGLLNNSLDKLGLRHKILEHQAIAKWREVVGKHIAASTIPEKVRDGVMFVTCKSSVWSSELSFHKNDIIRKLNTAAGRNVITDIRFSARGFAQAAREARKEESPKAEKSLEAIPVDDAQREAAAKVAAVCPAKELAEKVQRAVITSKRLVELKRQEGWKECPKCRGLHNGSGDICGNCR